MDNEQAVVASFKVAPTQGRPVTILNGKKNLFEAEKLATGFPRTCSAYGSGFLSIVGRWRYLASLKLSQLYLRRL
jgi:hypothetical protein